MIPYIRDKMDKMVPPRFHTRARTVCWEWGVYRIHFITCTGKARDAGDRGVSGRGGLGKRNPRRPGTLREHAARLARGRLGVGDHLAGAGPGATLTAPGRGAGQHSLPNLFLRAQTGVYIGIEIDIDRPRFAPSVFLRDIASRLPTP